MEDCLDTLRHPDLQTAVDGLLGRLLAHTGGKLDDDVALLLLLEATSPPARPEDDSPVAWRPPVARAIRSATKEHATNRASPARKAIRA